MIPRKLQLKNFLSYGADTQTIDFTPYRLICLSGKNGHGKSALLDAITWALWGQARKTTGSTKADQGLLRLGQTNMKVIFDFELNEQAYRICREFTHSYGKPYATLEFGMLNDDDTVIPLTDKTTRATQAKIEEVIRLDFESFANSAFLRQGQANEFSKKSPKERKNILASILGLNEYETIRKLAMEKARQASNEKRTVVALQEKIELDLQQETAITQEIKTVNEELKNLDDQEKRAEKEKLKLHAKRTELAEQQKKHDMLQFQQQQMQQELTKLQDKLRILFTSWRAIHKKLLEATDHRALETDKKKLVESINQHQQTLQKQLTLKEQLLKIEATAQRIRQEHAEQRMKKKGQAQIELERLLGDIKNLETTQTAAYAQLGIYETEKKQIDQELQTLQTKQKSQQSIHKQLHKIEQQFVKRKSYYQKFVAQGNWLSDQLQSLEQKKQLVHDEQDPSCPLCEQNLSASRRRFLKDKFDQQEQNVHHQLSRVTQIIPKLKTILIEQHCLLEQRKKEHDQYTQRNVKIDELGKAVQKLVTITQEIKVAVKKRAATITQLRTQHADQKKRVEQLHKEGNIALEQNSAYKKTEQQKIAVEGQLKQLFYNVTEHRQAQEKLHQLEQQLEQLEQLKAERTRQTQRQQEIQQLCATLKELKKETAILIAQTKIYTKLPEQLATLTQEEITLQRTTKEVTQKKESLLQQKGSLENKQTVLTKQQAEQKKNKLAIKSLDETIDDYQIIATATSKDGIQALLIEDTIPEIEQEANKLLSKLTNNQAQLFIESLRDLKKGGTKETLDIKISDAAGIRPYELFSGGEAFRIDFALRIAISKLLARRAGTALQTLIIDEGFGSQDEEGLSQIMEAIYKIQDDFHKIIIVSHLSAMKDQFPVHFVVEKSPSGSRVSITEQG